MGKNPAPKIVNCYTPFLELLLKMENLPSPHAFPDTSPIENHCFSSTSCIHLSTPLLSLSTLLYISRVINMVDVHIVLLLLLLLLYNYLLLLYTISNSYNKVAVRTTIKRVIYEKGCYSLCILPTFYYLCIVFFMNLLK